jgi:DNA-binding MarR family transcriptional regulator
MVRVNGVPEHVPLHIAALLDRARRRYRAEIGDAVADWRADLDRNELRDAAAALHGSHFRLLAHIPPAGARVTDIAELADITKQSTGELLAALAEYELVETVSDRSDRRTRVTRRTALGDEMVHAVNALIDQVERRWRARVGAADYDRMRRALIAIING